MGIYFKLYLVIKLGGMGSSEDGRDGGGREIRESQWGREGKRGAERKRG